MIPLLHGIYSSRGSGIPTDYLAYYPMDGSDVSGSTLVDQSGNGYNGTINGATQTSDYLSFDGSNDNVNALPKFLAGLSAFTFTIDAWFDTSGGDFEIFVQGAHNALHPFFFWYDEAATDHYAIYITDSADDNTGVLLSSAVPAISSWEKLCVTFDGDNEVRLFINGTEDANSPWSTPTVSNIKTTVPDSPATYNDSSVFGSNNRTSSNDKYLDGRLRRARFYNRVLSAAEIAAIAAEI